jgi:hypothetical protein
MNPYVIILLYGLKTVAVVMISIVFFLTIRTMRHGSLCQIEIDMSLKLSNYEDTVRQLDIYYGLGKLCYLTVTNVIPA